MPADRVLTVEDGQTLSLGGKTLQFIHTPWVHWPETMCTYLLQKGCPTAETFGHLDDLAAAVSEAHRKDERISATTRH